MPVQCFHIDLMSAFQRTELQALPRSIYPGRALASRYACEAMAGSCALHIAVCAECGCAMSLPKLTASILGSVMVTNQGLSAQAFLSWSKRRTGFCAAGLLIPCSYYKGFNWQEYKEGDFGLLLVFSFCLVPFWKGCKHRLIGCSSWVSLNPDF